MSNPYANLANIPALPPSFYQHNPGLANLNMADFQQMSQQFGMDMGGQGHGNQQSFSQQQQQHQPQFNMAALANIPPSALGGIQLPNQGQHGMNQGSQQQSQQNQSNNFNLQLEAFHRIQAQDRLQAPDVQKNNANAGPSNQQQQSLPQGPHGQQFLQQMNNMARMQQQQSQQQGGGNGGQQMRGMNGVNLQAVMAGMAAQGMGQGSQGQGSNPHSQQQGLQVGQRGGDEDTESGRRIALQNMLAQTLIAPPQQQHQQQQTPYQQQMQLPQGFQSQQQQPQLSNNQNLQPEILKILMNLPPHQREPLLAKHNNNPQAAVQELLYQHVQRQAAQQQGQGQGGTTPNLQAAQPRMPQAVSVNGVNQQQQQGQGRGGYGGHQRSDSQQMQGGQGPSPMQGQGGGQNASGANFDQKQFEALQQMKERQQRTTGLVTPQMGQSSSLPMVSPQPPNQQLQQQQQQQQYRQTPQNAPAQLLQQQQQQQQSFNGQQQQQQGRGSQDDNAKPSMADVIRQWSDDQLKFQTANLLKKMIAASPNEHPSRFALLTFMADFKRRNLPVPQEAISVMGSILGGAPAVHQMLQSNWAQLQAYAQKSASQQISGGGPSQFQASGSQGQFRQPQLPGQQSQQQQQQPQAAPFMAQRQSSMSGTQNNPIEIVTPKLGSTPSLSNAAPLPFTPSSQHAQLQPGQPGHQRQSSYNGQNLVPPTQQAQSSQQQQQSSPSSRWGGMDFRDEQLPFSEPQMWDSLKKMHKRPDLPVPTVDGRSIDVYALSGLVHRNGGSHRLDQAPHMWSVVAGLMGLGGQNNGEQPPRAGPQTTADLRRVYQVYLGDFENAWYNKLQAGREQRSLNMAQQQRQLSQGGNFGNNQSGQFNQQMGQPGSTGSSNQPLPLPIQQAQLLQQQQQFQNLLQQAQQSNQPLPANLSTQLLEAASRNPGMLSEQQRQFIEHARRNAGAGPSGTTPSMPNMGLLTPSMSSQTSLPQTHGVAAAMLSAQNQAQNASQQQPMSGQAAMQHAAQSLRGNPGLCMQWIKSKEEQMKFKFATKFVDVAEPLRPQLCAEVRTLAAAARDAQDKMPRYLLVSAEKGPEEFARISGLIQLYMAILITNGHAEQGRFCFLPDQVQRLKHQLASLITFANTLYEEYRAGPDGLARLDRLFGNASRPSPRDTAGTSSNPALAANMPKGLRVEDLKPPPSKRAKGKAGANGSPAPGAAAPTPESASAKTPASHIADSPIATSSPAGPAKKTAKRKRGGTVNAAKDDKDGAAKDSTGATPVGQMPPPPAPQPPVADAIPTPAEIEAAQNRAFFKAWSELEQGDGGMDIFAAFASVVEEFNAALESGTTTLPPPGPESASAGDSEFFAQWIDVEQLNGLPTPELYFPGLLDDDPNTSPESIKTVGSTAQAAMPVSAAVAVEKKGEAEEAERRLIEMSPGSGAYNGGLFWEEYDFGMGIAV